jgi:hypothetical protein
MTEIPFDAHTFDQALWNTLVVPRCEFNLYRERLVPLQVIRGPSTRAAVVAKALAHVAGKPSLLSSPCVKTVMFFAITLTMLP